MASSYSTDLKLELMVTGENAGTWGDNTNNNLNLIQQAIAGYEAVALTDGGTVALAMTDKTISNARNMVLKFTGTLTTASIVTIPDSIEKFYIFDCSAVSGPTNLTIKTASGTGFTLDAAKIYAAYSDGTNLNEISLDTLGGTIAFADVTGTVSTAQISDNAITTAKISDNQITTAKISDNQITTAKISDNQITTAKIANDAVGPDQLSNTAVTPGSYTAASITVDAQGRITAASSGSGGASGFVPRRAVAGPASGTHTFQPSTVSVLALGGSGGGGGGVSSNNGGPGGTGAFGVVLGTKPAPGTAPFSVGAPGNPGGGSMSVNGGAGGATNLPGFFTISGGAGGNAPGPAGSPGSFSPQAPAVPNISAPGFFGTPNTFSTAGSGGRSSGEGPRPAGAGGVGVLNIFESDA